MNFVDMRRLSPDHRRHVESLLDQRTQVAWQFTTVASVLGVGVAFLTIERTVPEGVLLAVGMSFALFTVASLLVWMLGWRRVLDMRRDLDEGQLATRTGPIERIETKDNAYGETVTHVTIAGVRHTTRERLFDGFQAGETVAVEHLPRSGVPLAVRHA